MWQLSIVIVIHRSRTNQNQSIIWVQTNITGLCQMLQCCQQDLLPLAAHPEVWNVLQWEMAGLEMLSLGFNHFCATPIQTFEVQNLKPKITWNIFNFLLIYNMIERRIKVFCWSHKISHHIALYILKLWIFDIDNKMLLVICRPYKIFAVCDSDSVSFLFITIVVIDNLDHVRCVDYGAAICIIFSSSSRLPLLV